MESQNEMELLIAEQQQQIIELKAELAATFKLLITQRELSAEWEYACNNVHETLDTIQHQFDYGY